VVEDMALDHLLIMFIDDYRSELFPGLRIIFHGKPQASDLEDGRQGGSPARLTGELPIEIGSDSGRLIFKARLRCDEGQLSSMHLRVDTPPGEVFRSRVDNRADVVSSTDCVEGRVIQRDVQVTRDDGGYF